jgi:hypothetical protein
MLISDDQLLGALEHFNTKQIQLAGQRYTPGVEPGAPNLQVVTPLTAVEGVGCGLKAQERLVSFVDAFIDVWDRAQHSCETREQIQQAIDALGPLVGTLLPRMRARDATAPDDWTAYLASIKAHLEVQIRRWRDEDARVSAEESKHKTNVERGHSSERDSIRSHINDISRCIGMLSDEQEFVMSPSGKVLVDPFLLIRGEWGTGKTHLLCDVTLNRVHGQQATLFLLAKSFQGNGKLLDMICGQIATGLTPQELVDQLQQLGVAHRERSLIIVDGVNEGRRAEWRDAISELLTLVRGQTHVGLIVSCRTPFEHIAIDETDLTSFHEITHHGFEDQEFDAQAAFFQHYKLPLPEVPLLDAEFSRPLTLKLICQSLKDLTGKKLSKGFSGIASGQKGMTFVLESFVNRVGKGIEEEFGLPAKACWMLLKGNTTIANRKVAGFAPNMAETLREYVVPRAADHILAAHFPALAKKRRRALLDVLRTSGLIDEDAIWYRAGAEVKSRIVYRLPYQRFSDHLIARHLLEAHLNVSSEAAVKRSFAYGKPLGRIFRSKRYPPAYAYAGWAQALITEFPERVKKKVPSKRRELVYFLPRAAQRASLYFEPFIEGLFWRDPSAFTGGTQGVINWCLNLKRPDAWNRTIDALVAVSTKPKHPYHTWRLYQFLAQHPMHVRDLQWSEYLRRGYSSPTIRRLLTWAERLNVVEMSEEVANELVVLLSLTLTTVVHRDRDVATKALVSIGEQYPRVLFEHVVATLEFNDPYVPERMLAAAYGVTMSLVDVSSAPTFRAHLGWLARSLYQSMFKPHAPHGTHHALRRDYAIGIIQLAQHADCVVLPKTAPMYLSPPFTKIASPFPDITAAPPEVHEAVKSAIHMDFGNYTMGRLIPDRGNYDDKHPEYIRVRAQIEQRIYDLGYRKELFEQVDRQIAQSDVYEQEREGRKVDRYGKKYSWIAYFEMYGLREANRMLPDWRIGERTPDVDIDPSFPKRPIAWAAPIPDLFGDLTTDPDTWVGRGETPDFAPLLSVPEINGTPGPWVLLDGFVRAEREDIDRELFAFLRGLFVARKDIARLRQEFLSIDYPGNSSIPDNPADYYLYAGEAGRSARYGAELHMANGKCRRQTREAFSRYVESAEDNLVDETNVVLGGGILEPRSDQPAPDNASTGGIENVLRSFLPRRKFTKVPGVRIELPVRSFSWESYHSSQNDFSGFSIPSPSIIQRLELASWNREIDFRDKAGQLATVYREEGNGWKGDHFSLLYIRQDLLRQYLRATRQKLVWCNWGERGWSRKEMGDAIRSSPTRVKILEDHLHIHRRFEEWEKT